MIVDINELVKVLNLEKDEDGTSYLSFRELNNALAIAAARTDVEKEIDKALCNLKKTSDFNNEDLKKDYNHSMFECIQYFREAGHLKDLDKI